MPLDPSEGRGNITVINRSSSAGSPGRGAQVRKPSSQTGIPADDDLLITMLCPDRLRGPVASAGASGSIILPRYIAYNI